MSAQNASVNAYLRTKVLTASPEELRLLLLDGAIKFARQAREGLIAKNYEQSFTGFSNCRNIIVELMTSMRPEIDPELCAKLTSLYTFLFNQLVEASLERNVEKTDKVLSLLDYERETWVLLMQKISAEQAHAAKARTSLSLAPAEVSARQPALSVQG